MNLSNPTLNLVLQASGITKTFSEASTVVEVLKQVDLAIKAGEMLAITGPSGSGKSTLLHILGGLDQPTSGKVEICGVDIHVLTEKDKSKLRNNYLGFIYQFHHLLPEFTALENVSMPLLIAGVRPKEAMQRARDFLSEVGLENRVNHRIGELSGGERQRVAVARALVNNPKCILADEPTGNLDNQTALQVYELMATLNATLGTAFVIVTHDLSIAKRMQRILVLRNGCFIAPN